MASTVYRVPATLRVARTSYGVKTRSKMYNFAKFSTFKVLRPEKQNIFARLRYTCRIRRIFYLWKIFLKKQKSEQIDFVARIIQRNLRKGFNAFLYRYEQWQLLKRVVTRPDKKQVWAQWNDFVLSKQEGDKFKLAIASRYWVKERLRSFFVQWQRGIYFFEREREIEMNGIALLFWQRQQLQKLYVLWRDFVGRRKRTSCLLSKLFFRVLKKHQSMGFRRWASFSRRVALYRKRAIREALHFWNNRYTLLIFKNWKALVKKVKRTRQKLLMHAKNKEISSAFKAWYVFYKDVKNKKLKLRGLIERAVSRWTKKKLTGGFRKWQNLLLEEKELPPLEIPKELEYLFQSAKQDVISYQRNVINLGKSSANSNTPGKDDVDKIEYDDSMDDIEFLELLGKVAASEEDDDETEMDDDDLLEFFFQPKVKRVSRRGNANFKFRYSGVGNTSTIDVEPL